MYSIYLEAQIVNTSSCQNNISSGIEDFLNSLFRNIRFSSADSIELLRVCDENLNSHFHFGFLKREIKACNLGVCDLLNHRLGSNRAVEGVTSDEKAFPSTFAMSLKNVDRLDWIDSLPFVICNADSIGSVNTHGGEEVRVGADDFARHRCLGGIDQTVLSKLLDAQGQIVLNVLHSLPLKQSHVCQIKSHIKTRDL